MHLNSGCANLKLGMADEEINQKLELEILALDLEEIEYALAKEHIHEHEALDLIELNHLD